MIYLFHGDSVGESRTALLKLRKTYPADAVSIFDAKDFDENEFLRALETPAMFSERRLVVVEGRPAKPLGLKSQISNLSSSTDLAFWVGEQLKTSDRLFKWVKEHNGQIRQFKEKIPRHVFGFLDALGYKNKKKAFLELHRLLSQGESPVYLLTMMVWQVRNLLRVTLSPNQKVRGINPYVLRKVKGQARNFAEEELVLIFKSLLNAEIALKTTSRSPELVLDQLVASITN